MIKREQWNLHINKGQGFFSMYNTVLGLIHYCLKENRAPNVITDECLYSSGEEGENAWEHFFEPLEIYDDKYEIEKEIRFGSDFKEPVFQWLPKHFPKTLEIRKRMNKLCSYIKIRKDILDISDKFVKDNFTGKRVIGVHVRGTDRGGDLAWYAKVKPEEAFGLYIKEIKNRFPVDLVYVATDDIKFISFFKFYRDIRDKIIYRKTIRSVDRRPIHLNKNLSGKERVQSGIDALVDALILSKCDHFICSYSNLSSIVLCWNPYLPYTNLAHTVQDHHDFFGL